MDPQRLLMTHVWRAIEDAGYAPSSLSGSNTAVLIGTAPSGYGNLLVKARQQGESYAQQAFRVLLVLIELAIC